MQKNLTLILVLVLSLIFLAGCTGIEKSSDKQRIDISDMDGLYDYVNAEIFPMSREDFDTGVGISFLDVTGDDMAEALMVNNMDWSKNIEMVSIEGDRYKNIKTDLQIHKYKNEFEMQDGFIKVVQATGGTGQAVEFMSLLKYDNGRMITVLRELELSLRESGIEDWYRDYRAEIKGPLTHFQYILDKDENGKKSVERRLYTFNEDTFSFEEKSMQ